MCKNSSNELGFPLIRMAEFTNSKRGKRKLLFQGYIYVLDRDFGEKTYWRCEKRRVCHGRANAVGDHVLETTPHCHPRDQTKCEVLEVVNEMKLLASTTGEPADKIVADTIQLVDESVVAKLPSNKSLTRIIRRVRRAKGVAHKRHRRGTIIKKDNHPPSLQKKSKMEISNSRIQIKNDPDTGTGQTAIVKNEMQVSVNSGTIDEKYFKGYSNIATHSDMIADYHRTAMYQRAILTNYETLYGKIVADVGCGTGILSVFCVKAGARKVYAIEASDIVEETRKVVAANGMQDRIVVLHGKAEDIELPETVDVIVSEWMGYMLLFESMLQSVLHVRDRWLKQNGKMFPEKAELFLAPITESVEFTNRVEFWNTVKDTYDVDMSPLCENALAQLCKTVSIIPVASEDVHSHAVPLFELELTTILPSELISLEGSFKCPCFGHSSVLGFAIWFTVTFPGGLMLTTSPYEEETHWKQAVLHVQPLAVHQDSIIEGKLILKQSHEDHRCLDVELTFALDDQETKTYFYKMNAEL